MQAWGQLISVEVWMKKHLYWECFVPSYVKSVQIDCQADWPSVFFCFCLLTNVVNYLNASWDDLHLG